ncbi:hypothetical protein LAZ67_X004169 [Cordylochernes scorpioides]|uniref:RNA-directed DNA polymerase from mobile element jockey n=1 Tax=Cordylochernes scorpioides TaxID=51811 RepID=A0ABY6LWW7_9ARAC|nr:hypothetical protein LAZ67_X004169 [Cordylochernes scorpioides]
MASKNYEDRTMMNKCHFDIKNREHFCRFEVGDLVLLEFSRRKPERSQGSKQKCKQGAERTPTLCGKMKLIINPNKSEVGVFTINNHLKKWTPNIKYDNNQIKFSRTPKYLVVTLDPSLTYGPHINQTVLRAKKRLNILKRISGYEWGADRDTLRKTYLALIRPILEYAQPVWQTASKTNLNKIDQIQSSAARIISGLRNTCPTKIAEMEANLLPLTHRRKIGLADYIYKRVNAPKSHRTSEFIRKWKPKPRLKRLSPMHLAYRELLPNSTRNRNAQNLYAPYKERPEIYNLDLEQECSKGADHPGLLRSLTMERIEKADKATIQIYTDGSLVENSSSGSGVLILKDSMEIKRRIKNPKNLSVFRSELTAILQALKLIQKPSSLQLKTATIHKTDSSETLLQKSTN